MKVSFIEITDVVLMDGDRMSLPEEDSQPKVKLRLGQRWLWMCSQRIGDQFEVMSSLK